MYIRREWGNRVKPWDQVPGIAQNQCLTNLSQLPQAINLMLETTGSNPSCSTSSVWVLAGVACLDLGSDLRGTVVSSGHEGDQNVGWKSCIHGSLG